MLFSSITFLYYFLPLVLILTIAAPKKGKNLVLLLASLVFYAWGEPIYVLLMVLLILVGYLTGRLLAQENERLRKVVLVVGIALCLGALGYFKYWDFFLENINAVFHTKLSLRKLSLPIGISFYTFQIISYMADVYRGQAKPQKSLLKLATYVSMFPQLIAGPIVRYVDVEQQLTKRSCSIDQAAWGIRRFLLGLGKKVLIANTLGEFCQAFVQGEGQSVAFVWAYALATGLQVYFDFSGYSDMAIGLGRLFGFSFPENFQYPFTATSITGFWRRWHMTLGTWFRDYVYIPLGGNRAGTWKWLRNLFLVWFLTGFWHGAAWNFVGWGLYFAVLLFVEKKWLLSFLQKRKLLARIYVLVTVSISFVLFDASGISQAVWRIGSMFGAGGLPLFTPETGYYLKSYGVILVAALFGATPLVSKAGRTITGWKKLSFVTAAVEIVGLFLLLIVITAFLVDGSFNPFLYFRF